MHPDVVSIIFGMKIRQARLETNLSVSEFAARSGLSPSYVTEIEKGRKYPKTDKIINMARVLGKAYDELVSVKLEPGLRHLETVLSSPLLRTFPFEEFDLDLSDVTGLLTRTPDKVSALLHTIVEIARQYDMKDEYFLRAALRSYQEINDNYFPQLEAAAQQFAKRYQLHQQYPIPLARLRELLTDTFGYELDEHALVDHPALRQYRALFFSSPRPRLLTNARLLPMQVRFLLARELGYVFLGLKERSNTSTPDEVHSFYQVYNDFQASYFAGALLMPYDRIVADLRSFFAHPTFEASSLAHMLQAYAVTPEMLLYRLSEVIPQAFDTRLHFLRFQHINGTYKLIKRLNMNTLLLPSGIALHEHYCRRWLSSRLLIELEQARARGRTQWPLIAAQTSEFLESGERFLCLGFARPLVLTPHIGSSVIIGFQVSPTLHNTIHFVNDPAIPQIIINETCERCPLTAEQCHVRGAQPTILEQQQRKAERQAAILAIQQNPGVLNEQAR